jgi:hypothetical protein
MYHNAKPSEQVPPCNQVLLVVKVMAELAMGALRSKILFRENACLPEGLAGLTENSGASNFSIRKKPKKSDWQCFNHIGCRHSACGMAV